MTLSFSAQTNSTCDECSNRAQHGFFVSHADDPDSEIFLCSGCAQKSIDARSLDEAIDEHRQVCFDRAEREAALEDAYMDWINSYEEVAAVC